MTPAPTPPPELVRLEGLAARARLMRALAEPDEIAAAVDRAAELARRAGLDPGRPEGAGWVEVHDGASTPDNPAAYLPDFDLAAALWPVTDGPVLRLVYELDRLGAPDLVLERCAAWGRRSDPDVLGSRIAVVVPGRLADPSPPADVQPALAQPAGVGYQTQRYPRCWVVDLALALDPQG